MNIEILNKYIQLIEKGYCNDCNELNCIDNFPHKKIAIAIEQLIQKYNKALELLSEYNLPCEIDDFMNKNTDYCFRNCSQDEEIYKKCWDRFIEQKLDFLTKRENKLQQIEQMFKSGTVDLDELRKIVLEKEV